MSFIFLFTELRSLHTGFPGSSDGKESTCNVGDPGSIPGSGKSPVEGNGNLLQYSCLENSMDTQFTYSEVHIKKYCCLYTHYQ